MSVVTTHNAGFFSCCSVKLDDIVSYINTKHSLPIHVDSSKQFQWYKKDTDTDITYEYFQPYYTIPNIKVEKYPIKYSHLYQFLDYTLLEYNTLVPIVKKYFSPSLQINQLIANIEEKYHLVYDNICVIFYRGNDKITETKIGNYQEYAWYAKYILHNNPNIVFLIQSDETEFIEFITSIFPTNSFYFKDEIRHISKCNSTVDIVMKETNDIFSKYYLAITIIMSKCKYIICSSGNCSLWIMLYRGHNRNVYQYLHGKWIYHKNTTYIGPISIHTNTPIHEGWKYSNRPLKSRHKLSTMYLHSK